MKTKSEYNQVNMLYAPTSRDLFAGSRCARHGAQLSGESPQWAESNWSTSLGKGVHREVGSEGSRWQSKVVTNSQ